MRASSSPSLLRRPVPSLASLVAAGTFAAAAIATAAIATVPRAAAAQSIEEAQRLYKARDYRDAALLFFDILSTDPDPNVRDQAQVYLAETLRRLDLWVPSMFYYSDLFRAGPQNRYYLNAVEGLLAIAELWHDSILIPSLINEGIDIESFGQLDEQKISQVNYMLGDLAYRQRRHQEARDYLSYVAPESPYHPRARYLLGLLAVNEGKADEAQQQFEGVIDLIDEDTDSTDLRRLRHLALLAAGRNAYGAGRYAEAAEYYERVPRFSESWFTALYEVGWAYFRQEEYGKTLGAIQSVSAPYFAKRHVPESYVVAAITFFVNCQWDRVRRELGKFRENYQPMLAHLEEYLAEERPLVGYYLDVVRGGAGRYSIEIARDVRRMKRFKDFHFMLEHLRWEREQVNDMGAWQGGRMQEQLRLILDAQMEDLGPAVGDWVRGQLGLRARTLKNFQTQIEIFDFEVTDAERRWLEQGQEILKGRRARLPRPKIPNDQWQHWSFEGEYWKDELGYLQHTIATECREEEDEEGALDE